MVADAVCQRGGAGLCQVEQEQDGNKPANGGSDVADSESKRLERQRSIPRQSEIAKSRNDGGTLSDANSERQQEQHAATLASESRQHHWCVDEGWREGWWLSEPDVGRSLDGLPSWLDGCIGRGVSNAENTRRVEALRALWSDHVSKTLRRAIGGFERIQQAEILFSFLRQYENGIDQARLLVEGKEVDDYVCTKACEHFDPKGSVETYPIVIAFVDKDIQQNSPGALFNYFHPEEGVFWNSVEDQYKGFWKSVLTGDVADNILGVESLGEATRALYGIKTKGCGPVAAGRILTGISSEKEAAERVLATYKESWPDDYLERLQDMCFFLWLQREEGQMFDLKKYFDKLNISY